MTCDAPSGVARARPQALGGTGVVGASEGDHVSGLLGCLTNLGAGLGLRHTERLAGLHRPEARHHQLLVQVPSKYVTFGA